MSDLYWVNRVYIRETEIAVDRERVNCNIIYSSVFFFSSELSLLINVVQQNIYKKENKLKKGDKLR